MTVIGSRTAITSIMTLGLVRRSTCLPNKTEVAAIPSLMVEWHATTLRIVNISRYLFQKRDREEGGGSEGGRRFDEFE